MGVHFTKKKNEGGGTRDDNTGKILYDCIPTTPVARAIADVMTEGAKNHGKHNWKRGIRFDRLKESYKRHIHQFFQGQEDEDHLTQAIINLLMLKHFIVTERWELNDLPEEDAPHLPRLSKKERESLLRSIISRVSADDG